MVITAHLPSNGVGLVSCRLLDLFLFALEDARGGLLEELGVEGFSVVVRHCVFRSLIPGSRIDSPDQLGVFAGLNTVGALMLTVDE